MARALELDEPHPHTTPGLPGRPRSTEADQAIRAATLDLLARDGYANLTMSGVAGAAGVSTATLYRRWRSKLELVVGVLRAHVEERPIPNTGSLAGDCRALLHGQVEAVLTSPSAAVMAGLVGELARNAELADAFRATLVQPRRHELHEMLDRAATRGELRPDVDYDVVADLLYGPLHNRRFITGQVIAFALADELAELVLRAIAAEPQPSCPPTRRRGA
ncbi:MAG TPA: TetR/AcrR family transcriptional regulator [Acidimicrobiales bacterium]|nr:TetR/AcrR family transcriptional regulator [Acidimicrobiales bacterium]